MDPIDRAPDDHGQDADPHGERDSGPVAPRQPRDPLMPELGHQTPARVRTVQLVAGDFLLTVNPVDGSEIAHCPPGAQPPSPQRHGADERADLLRASGPPVPPGPAAPELPLLERQDERERLVRLLARGRSVRLTGASGAGRTTLLDAVARDCVDLAPDGVIRLSGYHRTPADLLHGLFAAVFDAPLHRPDKAELLGLVHRIGAVVVLDDLEFGGAALEELLEATPECAFLIATTPDVTAPLADSHLEEIFLGGIGRGASLELLERVVERPLTEEETHWAGDLWFESEGLPLRFVQAGALLRRRDLLRADPDAFDEFGYFSRQPGDAALIEEVRGADAPEPPLPTIGEGAAPAVLLAAGLSESARITLRFAVALGGEVPHQAHLPALVGDTHADAALGELAQSGLLSPTGSHYRLAAGVVQQLESGGYGDEAAERAQTVAQHYAWWTGHPSVAPERAAAEADAVLAAMGALVIGSDPGHAGAAVLLARGAAPAFAAGLHWGAWERALRTGQEAARISGEVAEEAYFHHELGVLALCTGHTDRARAELEASIALRGALADRHGTVAGRRALALIADRSGSASLGGLVPALAGGTPGSGEPAPAGNQEPASPPDGIPAAGAVVSLRAGRPAGDTTLVTQRATTAAEATLLGKRRTVVGGARRNLVAVGAGALLAAVLGTFVTLGATGSNDPDTDNGKEGQSVSEDTGGLDVEPSDSSSASDSTPTSGATGPSSPGTPRTSDSATQDGSGTPSAGNSSTQGSDRPPSNPSKSSTPSNPPSSPTHKPPHKPSGSPSSPPPSSPTGSPSPSPSNSDDSGIPPPANSPSSSDSATSSDSPSTATATRSSTPGAAGSPSASSDASSSTAPN